MSTPTLSPQPAALLSSSHGVGACCALLDQPHALLDCVNASASSHRAALQHTGPGGIGLVTFMNDAITGYSAYAAFVNEAYSEVATWSLEDDRHWRA